jgi:hypothetical protein
MKASFAWRIGLAAALLIALLTGMLLREERQRRDGREVLLATEVVDPRDLLTGHYAALSLAEPLAVGEACPPGSRDLFGAAPSLTDRREPPGWVALQRRGDHDVAVGMAKSREAALRLGAVAVRGMLKCAAPRAAKDGLEGAPGQVVLDIGVSRFHADQSMAEGIEAAVRSSRADQRPLVIVSVGTDGRARLSGVVIGRKRVMLSWF